LSAYSPERLAYWYFRLNGFLTTENFVVHPEHGSDVRTDADLLAIRFRNRVENSSIPMPDDPRISECSTLVNMILAEVKRGACALNGPWTNRDKCNMQRVLGAVGCVQESLVEAVANSLYESGMWQGDSVTLRLFALGESKSELIVPQTQQITWSEVIDFCIGRFEQYRLQKSAVGQWTKDGRQLRGFSLEGRRDQIRTLFGLAGGG
jgi:hypothetical protein